MEAKECIKTRRSIRKFTNDKVTKEEFEELIALSSFAPSWKNSQTSRYTVVLDEEIKEKIAKECMMNHEGNENTILGAPAIIILTTVNSRSGYERDGSFTTSKETHWQSFDAGIAAQTLCLAAHTLGLGTVIMGIYDEENVAEVLNIPEEQSVSAIIAIGHPVEIPDAPKRKEVETLLAYK